MSKLFTLKANKKSTIVVATQRFVGAGYKRMLALAQELDGIVDTDKKSNFAKITFGDTSKAEKFVAQFTQEYTKAHKAYAKQTKSAQKADTKKTPSSSKKTPKKAKGNSFDFGKIKGATKSEKNKALHKALVGMGIADSRTPEYTSIWDARPWAK